MPVERNQLSNPATISASVEVALEPAYNQLHDLALLSRKDRTSGLGEWVLRTREGMSLEQLQRNRLVMEGLFYAFTTEARLPSFGAYIDHLTTLPAQSFQDRLLWMYSCAQPQGCTMPRFPPAPPENRSQILSSVDRYLAFLGEHFDSSCLDLDLEAQAYRYAVDPPAMKSLIVDHLRTIWESHLAPEWTRIRPMLSKAVEAFDLSHIGDMERLEAVRFVIGREPEAHLSEQLVTADKVVLAPSAHVGPYLGKFIAGRDLVVLFGARLPEGARVDVPDLSRTEILTKLDALSDGHRLQILRMAAETGEFRATEVMTKLDISQSAASRSLTQLTATGYLVERRRDGAKFYSLNPGRIQDTLAAIQRFLGIASSNGSLDRGQG